MSSGALTYDESSSLIGMKVAVTGASGYIGELLVENLKLNYEVIRYGRGSTEREFNMKTLSFTSFDDIDIVIHCAWNYDSEKSDIQENSNVLGLRAILDSIKNSDKSSMIFLSSVSATDNPKSQYGKIKKICEDLIIDSNRGVSLRLGLVTSQKQGGFVGRILNLVNQNKYLILPISKNIKVRETPIKLLEARIEEIISSETSIIGTYGCYSSGELTLRNFIRDNSDHQKYLFLPVHPRVLWFLFLFIERTFPKLGLRSDSVKSLF